MSAEGQDSPSPIEEIGSVESRTGQSAPVESSDDDFDQMPELMDVGEKQPKMESADAGGGDQHVVTGGKPEDVATATGDAAPMLASSIPDSASSLDPTTELPPSDPPAQTPVSDDHLTPETTSSVEELEMPNDAEDKSVASMSDSFEHISIPDSLYEKDLSPTTGTPEKDLSEENTKAKGAGPDTIDVIGNGKIMKTVIVEGYGFDSRPKKGEAVTVNYEGRTEDGEVVDSAQNVRFLLNEGDIIQGLDLAVSLMQMNEKASVTIHPDFGYGSKGSKSPKVPENAKLTYEIELLKNEGLPEFQTMSFQDKFAMAEAKRLRGNSLYMRQEYHMAVNSYTRALTILDHEDSPTAEEMKQLNECRQKCENNLAICQIKVGAYDAAIKSCDNVLKLDKDNVKAYFRKGKAYSLMSDFENAVKFLRKAQELEPLNKDISTELNKVTQTHRSQEDKCKEMYRNMLGNPKPTPKKKVSTFPYWMLFSGSAFAAGLATIGYAVYQMMTDTIP